MTTDSPTLPRSLRQWRSGPVPLTSGGAMTGPAAAGVSSAVQPSAVTATVASALRRDLRRLGETLRNPVDERRRLVLRRHVQFLLAELEVQHRVEHALVWPAAIRRRPDLAGLRDETVAEHGRLGWVIDRVQAATRRWQDDDRAREQLRCALLDLEVVLDPQVTHRENEVLPAWSQALTVQDWRRVDARIRRLPASAHRAWWLLDDLDGPQAEGLRHALPHLVPARMLSGRAWRRERRLLWD